MQKSEFIQLVQRQVAEIAVGASALRNQGGKGLIKTAREYFKSIDLNEYGSAVDQKVFISRLDTDTNALRASFAPGARNWGAARKAMNLFLRDACYNRFLCEYFGLGRIESWLEVPLDKDVATGLLDDLSKTNVTMPANSIPPSWSTIKLLTRKSSDAFQALAQSKADMSGISRVHVDLQYWRR